MNVGGSKLPFSEAPSFLTSRILPFSRHVTDNVNYIYHTHGPVSMYLTTPINTFYLLRVRGSELPEEETER